MIWDIMYRIASANIFYIVVGNDTMSKQHTSVGVLPPYDLRDAILVSVKINKNPCTVLTLHITKENPVATMIVSQRGYDPRTSWKTHKLIDVIADGIQNMNNVEFDALQSTLHQMSVVERTKSYDEYPIVRSVMKAVNTHLDRKQRPPSP